jgi:hypothetical protein
MATRVLNIVENPPRPASGTGEVTVDASGTDVVLKWENGEITEVNPVTDDADTFDVKMVTSDTGGTLTCIKCLVADSGEIICWPVPC